MRSLILCIALSLPFAASAGDAIVENATASKSGNTWRFNVTISHSDTGWDHYADGWGVYLEDGTELGYRVLAHPHVNEQPFTRSLTGVVIPDGTTEVYVVPRDSVHGVSDERVKVSLN